MILVSLDIDGTLEGGDPPGPVPYEFARRVGALGALVGSSSDRALADQREFWRAAQVRVDFMVLKHQLARLPARCPGCRYLHLGDSMMDEYYAGRAGFEFWNARSLARHVIARQLVPAQVTEYLLSRLGPDASPPGPGARPQEPGWA